MQTEQVPPSEVPQGLPLNLKKGPAKPPRGPNNYTQERERKAKQTQHLNNKPPLVPRKAK
jgi:hypothetical protein